jgi:hypothetical protein
LFDDAASRNEWLQGVERVRSTPREYNAVYRGVYNSIHLRLDREPWPSLGSFTIENSDGSKVVYDDLPMAVGGLTFMPGQVLKFTAMPKELVFGIYPRQFYTLNPAAITNTKETNNDATNG